MSLDIKVERSPFSYLEEQVPVKFQIDADVLVMPLLKNGTFGNVERAIVSALYKYPYMHFSTIRLYLSLIFNYEPDFYRDLLKKMVRVGAVQKIKYGDVLFYSLNPSVREEWKKKVSYSVTLPAVEDAASILEYASLAQFVVKCKVDMRKKVADCMVYQVRRFRKTRLVVPSFVFLKQNSLSYRIFAYRVPGKASEYQKLADRIESDAKLFAETQARRMFTLFVLTTDSEEAAKEFYRTYLIRTHNTDRTFYFAPDFSVAEQGALASLFYFSQVDGQTVVRRVSLGEEVG